ncbi:unnamed protein product, partial [marine sediment metagenome]
RLNESIVKPGGGEAGQAMMLQAFGFGKPGGGSSYYEAKKRQQEGATPENVKAMFGEFGKQKGGGEAQILALETVTGLGITQLEELREVVQTMSGPGREAKLKEILDKAAPPEVKAAKGIADLGDMAKQQAIVTNHALTVGKQVAASVMAMQLAMNELVVTILPQAVDLLKIVAALLRKVANVASGGMDGTDKDWRVFGVARKSMPDGDIATNYTGKTVGKYDPIQLRGGDRFNEEERKAINTVIKQTMPAAFNEAFNNPKEATDLSITDAFMPGGLLEGKMDAQIAIQREQLIATQQANAANAAGNKTPLPANSAPPGIA